MPFRLEAAKDDYRIHCEELEKQLIEVQHRNDELTSLAEESRALKDELDVLRFMSVCVCVCVEVHFDLVDWVCRSIFLLFKVHHKDLCVVFLSFFLVMRVGEGKTAQD